MAFGVQPKPSTFDAAMCKLLMHPCQRVTENVSAAAQKRVLWNVLKQVR